VGLFSTALELRGGLLVSDADMLISVTFTRRHRYWLGLSLGGFLALAGFAGWAREPEKTR
jgi:hypothetical protein